ncbi:MAG: hypothetical protein LCH54_01950 [Bacteroidetes bacterium]|nr:hypothetical protein [Bacteroidota bacterium]
MWIKLTGFLFFLVLAIGLSGCDQPTEPKDQTPDTTSHNFQWTTYQLGSYGSQIRAVKIFSDNNIWAMGYFYNEKGDTSYDDLAIWNGTQWTYQKIRFRKNLTNFGRGIIADSYSGIEGILVINENDFVMCGAYGAIVRWDGKKWEYDQPKYEDEKYDYTHHISGKSTLDFYLFGWNVTTRRTIIIHYLNGEYIFIPNNLDNYVSSATTTADGTTYFSTFNDYSLDISKEHCGLYRIKNNQVEQLYTYAPQVGHIETPVEGSFEIKSAGNTLFGVGVHCNWKWESSAQFKPDSICPAYVYKANWAFAALSSKDMLTGYGEYEIAHWNGRSWRGFPELAELNEFNRMSDADLTKTLGVVSGWNYKWDPVRLEENSVAKIFIGKRY